MLQSPRPPRALQYSARACSLQYTSDAHTHLTRVHTQMHPKAAIAPYSLCSLGPPGPHSMTHGATAPRPIDACTRRVQNEVSGGAGGTPTYTRSRAAQRQRTQKLRWPSRPPWSTPHRRHIRIGRGLRGRTRHGATANSPGTRAKRVGRGQEAAHKRLQSPSGTTLVHTTNVRIGRGLRGRTRHDATANSPGTRIGRGSRLGRKKRALEEERDYGACSRSPLRWPRIKTATAEPLRAAIACRRPLRARRPRRTTTG